MLDRKALKYYTSLSLIPSKTSGAIALYTAMTLLVLVIDIIANAKIIIILLHGAILTLFPLLLIVTVPFFNTKRATTLGAVALAPTLVIEIIGAMTHIYGLCYAVLPLVTLLVVRGVSGKDGKFVMIALYAAIAELLFALAKGESLTDIVTRFVVLGATLAIAFDITRQVRLVGKKSGKDLFYLAHAWSRLMLAQDGSELEKFFNTIGREEDVRVRGLIFKRDDGTLIALLVPEVHFGPFRYLGSSALPYQIEQRLPPTVKAFVLHGAGSHERNASHSAESEKLAEFIARVLQCGVVCSSEIHKPMRVSDSLREAFVLPTSKYVLIAISSPVIGGDDLPYEVQRIADEIAAKYGYTSAIVVDCHNLEGKRETNAEKFVPLLKAALSRGTEPCTHLAIGYGEARAPFVRGLCNSKVKVLVLRCDSDLYALVYLYGNNAQMGVRALIRRMLLDRGFADVEVLTADDHTCSGTTFDAPYYAVEPNPSLLRAVSQAVERALADLKEASCYILDTSTRLKLVGHTIFELLELAKEAGDAVLRRLKIGVLLLYTITLTLALLRGSHLL